MRQVPELPDIIVYVEALTSHVVGRRLERLRLISPFVLRSVDPPITEVNSKVVRSVRRLGKRIAIGLDDDLFLVVHLMIAGRLRWREPGAKPGVGPKMVLAFLACAAPFVSSGSAVTLARISMGRVGAQTAEPESVATGTVQRRPSASL